MKKVFSAAIAAVLILVLSGCSFFLGESDTLLRAPEPGGELGEIRQALVKEIGEKFTLECAKSGNWRNAYVVTDTDGNGQLEALVFYSTTKNELAELHMAVITQKEKRWKYHGGWKLGGTDVERIEFGDMNGDGTEEIAVAWSIYGAPETRLSVLDINGKVVTGLFEGNYTDFCIFDMANAKGDELIIVSADAASNTARCSMLTAEGDSMKEISAINIDSGAIAVKTLHKTEVDKNPALFIDIPTAEGGMYTEIVTSNGEMLSAPLSRQGGKPAVITGRYYPLLCSDLNGDGTAEIPCMTVLPNGGNTEGTLGLTEWKTYKNGRLTTLETSVVSKLMHYKIKIDRSLGSFSCVHTGFDDGIDLYTYDAKIGLGQKVLSIIAISEENYKESDYKDMFKIGSNDKMVFLAKIHIENNPLGITKEVAKKMFSDKITEEIK